MPINWPPAGAPSWPPPEFEAVDFSASDLTRLMGYFAHQGLPLLTAAPTPDEHNQFFRDARCDEGHTVTGRMLIIGGVRYPVAVCDEPAHRDCLVQWPPYYCGYQSGNYEFI